MSRPHHIRDRSLQRVAQRRPNVVTTGNDATGEAATSPSEAYATSVSEYARQSNYETFYPAPHYHWLATFLRSALHSQPNGQSNGQQHDHLLLPDSPKKTPSIADHEPFAWFHTLQAREILDAGITLQELEDFNLSKTQEGNQATILTLRGHAPPEWLCAAGAKFSVDPEFWVQHLMLRAAVGRPNNYSLPSLPSGSQGILRLRITTIGFKDRRSIRKTRQQHVEDMRRMVRERMRKYHEHLRLDYGWKRGDSIVRHFSVHDEEHCSIEQDISIHVVGNGKGWNAVVWLDIGSDLSFGVKGPWTNSNFDGVQWLPVIQSKKNVAMNNTIVPSSGLQKDQVKTSPSVTLLHRAPCHSLDPAQAASAMSSPSLALSDLFRFSASSERQLLNLLREKIDIELEHVRFVEDRSSVLANLLYNQSILERHIRSIAETVKSLKTLHDAIYSIDASSHPNKSVTATKEAVLKDFEDLNEDAKEMLEQCDRGVRVLLSSMQFLESQRAITQSIEVAKLTRLAFIFIPVSYVASFFGMNFSEFGSDQLSIWVYFVISIPLLLLTLGVSLRKEIWSWLSSIFGKKKIPDEEVEGGGEEGVEMTLLASKQD